LGLENENIKREAISNFADTSRADKSLVLLSSVFQNYILSQVLCCLHYLFFIFYLFYLFIYFY